MEDIEQSVNIIEILEQDLLKEKSYEKNQLICGERAKAQLLIDEKFVMEIQENYPIQFQSQKGSLKLMARGRLMDELVRREGFQGGYIGVSFLEMDYSVNEAEYLLKVFGRVFDQK
uniref:Uncharacterized protein n=1 Tax=Strombidium rassoulzadegani TaxID=1082188 RepID=A0A7S3CP61_9SPIT|mmetsp:Transcript_19112/g.32586  ORF Transcript_19112/g.32586 Transcript_19112/m.32586 type:complete len:116 (+) Transcript_19112:650-997(+)